jgi:hypothetical protein
MLLFSWRQWSTHGAASPGTPMPNTAAALLRRALQHLWPTAGGQLTSAELYAHILASGLDLPTGALQPAWESLRDRGLVQGATPLGDEFVITWVDPSLLVDGGP